MSDAIERVALATCTCEPCICRNRLGFDGMPCLARGRAAIVALTDPTESMIEAGADAIWPDVQGLAGGACGVDDAHDLAELSWRAMVTRALGTT